MCIRDRHNTSQNVVRHSANMWGVCIKRWENIYALILFDKEKKINIYIYFNSGQFVTTIKWKTVYLTPSIQLLKTKISGVCVCVSPYGICYMKLINTT